MFVDFVKINASSGKGGDGCVSFRREKFVAFGGPDGGDGGKGGSVILEADSNMGTLLDFRYKKIYKAGNGQPGMGRQRHGKDAHDIIIKVPVGTVIKNVDTQCVIHDMKKNGEQFCLLPGGKGGRGNMNFATPTNQAPRTFTPGQPGKTTEIALELKLISDVGLVGLPNAGKSTLLSVISAARPKIANYPFTTLRPMLGVVKYSAEFAFTVADIPGLIKDAHNNKGLGLRFLRHIQRTKFLVFMLDMAFPVGLDAAEDLQVLLSELEEFDPSLLDKPRLIVANKMDMPDAEVYLEFFREKHPDDEIICISALSKNGVKGLLDRIAEMIKAFPAEQEYEEFADPDALDMTDVVPTAKGDVAGDDEIDFDLEGDIEDGLEEPLDEDPLQDI